MRTLAEETAAFSLSLIVFNVGLVLNSFIAAVTFFDWSKGRKVKASDKILCSLAISRLCHLCVCVYHSFLNYFDVSSKVDKIQYVTARFFYLMFSYTSLWFAALLSVFCLMKVADYKNSLFVHLKRLVLKRVPGCIVAILVVCLCYSCLHVWFMHSSIIMQNKVTGEHQMNDTLSCLNIQRYQYFYIAGNVGPFVIYGLSFFLLLTSLCSRVKLMRNSSTGFTTSHLDGYYAAMKSIAACFLIFSLQLKANIIHLICSIEHIAAWANILTYIFHTLHSSYLICGNPRLSQQFCSLLLSGRKCWVGRGDAQPNLSCP